jgi:hypothetical protein
VADRQRLGRLLNELLLLHVSPPLHVHGLTGRATLLQVPMLPAHVALSRLDVDAAAAFATAFAAGGCCSSRSRRCRCSSSSRSRSS